MSVVRHGRPQTFSKRAKFTKKGRGQNMQTFKWYLFSKSKKTFYFLPAPFAFLRTSWPENTKRTGNYTIPLSKVYKLLLGSALIFFIDELQIINIYSKNQRFLILQYFVGPPNQNQQQQINSFTVSPRFLFCCS